MLGSAQVVHHQNMYARYLESLVERGIHWLDVGAGSQLHDGWLCAGQAELAARAKLLAGCDPHVEHLNANPFLTVRVGGSAYSLPFRENSFQLVTANMVLEHIEQPIQMFNEIRRVLCEQGRFLFVTPSKANPIIKFAATFLHPSVRRTLASIVERREEDHVFLTHYKANSVEDIEGICSRSGFTVERLETFYTVPFTSQIPVLRNIESAGVSALQALTGNRYGTNLIGVLRAN
ncbi:MAG: methyltransferase domain-containing protein [Gemmatimonadaceae bacterium]|nr:methyltransferase domain-containing protein [Gemmatimonadaceae bacterium]